MRGGLPEPGFYKIRLVKGGPWCAARIEHGPSRDPETGEPLDRSPLWSVEINGDFVATPCPDPWGAGAGRVFPHGRRIDEAEYEFLLAKGDYARTWNPLLPEARPREAVDINSMAPIKP